MNVTEEAIKEVLETLRDSKAFALDQVPVLAGDIFRYGVANTIWLTCMSLLFLLIAIWTFKNARKSMRERDYNEGVWIMLGICSTIATIICISCTITNSFKLAFAPKLYIIESLVSLLK